MTGGQIVDELMNGLVSKAMANFDSKVTEELTNHLFEESGRPFCCSQHPAWPGSWSAWLHQVLEALQ